MPRLPQEWLDDVSLHFRRMKSHKLRACSACVFMEYICQDRLRSSRTPERITFRDELPYNETGKLLRRQIRAELAGEA